jgi:hypothetical protein
MGLTSPPATSQCEWIDEDEVCSNVIVKTCADVPPSDGESCLMYKGFGKCSASFMVGFCCQSCFDCEC